MNKSNKKIGIVGYSTGENSFGAGKSYLTFAARFGVPIILTPQHDVEELDLLILPGGADLNPETYGQRPSYYTSQPNAVLEYFDRFMLPEYINNNTPILAICRGAQRIYAYYGGEIVQHNGWHDQSKYNEDLAHELMYTEGFESYKKLLRKVNSRHHQTMSAKHSIPEELQVIAYASATKANEYYPSIIEIFKHKEKPILAIQFHSEDLTGNDNLIPMLVREMLKTEQLHEDE